MVYLKHTVGGKVTWSQGSLSSQDVQAVAGLASWTVINPYDATSRGDSEYQRVGRMWLRTVRAGVWEEGWEEGWRQDEGR